MWPKTISKLLNKDLFNVQLILPLCVKSAVRRSAREVLPRQFLSPGRLFFRKPGVFVRLSFRPREVRALFCSCLAFDFAQRRSGSVGWHLVGWARWLWARSGLGGQVELASAGASRIKRSGLLGSLFFGEDGSLASLSRPSWLPGWRWSSLRLCLTSLSSFWPGCASAWHWKRWWRKEEREVEESSWRWSRAPWWRS